MLLQDATHQALASPGAMPLTDLQNRTWHLLRENGPDTGFPIGSAGFTADFPVSVVTRDLNIALAQFISAAGIAPMISERMDTFPVYPVLDYPLPIGCSSITRIEYTPFGQQTYELIPKNFDEWVDDVTGGYNTNTTGQPFYYRQPFAGYIRLQPAPSIGNAIGPGVGYLTFANNPAVGQALTVYMTPASGAGTVTATYVCVAGDTPSTVAFNITNNINLTSAVTGINAFLAPAGAAANVVTLTSLTSPGTGITYYATLTGTAMTVTPASSAAFTPGGDTITFYYSSLGTILVNPGDTPGIPPQFHMALVYKVLSDYWPRKQSLELANHYLGRYEAEVVRAKSFVFDANRDAQPSVGGAYDEGGYAGPYTSS